MSKKGEQWSPEYRAKREKAVRDKKRADKKYSVELLKFQVAYLSFRVYRAVVKHGAPLTMVALGDNDYRWFLDNPSKHAKSKLNSVEKYLLKHSDEQLYFVFDNIDGELPITAMAGWKRVFTKEDAQRFIDKHNDKLLNLRAKLLFNYVNRMYATDTLRARGMGHSSKMSVDWRKWIDSQYEKLSEWEQQNKCVLCNGLIEGYGNNADPVARGKCCDECNVTKVMPARVAAMRGE
jgi:hypothetical protein